VNLRKNQKSLSASEKKNFIAAILKLKRKPSLLHPGDSNFGRYDDFVEVHFNAMMPSMMSPPQPGWAHQSVVFAPWHRVLLFQFETELQTIDSSVTIPYWDWTNDATSLWSPEFLGGNGTGADGRIVDGPFAGAANWPIRIKDGPDDPDYLRRQIAADPTATRLPSPEDQSKVMVMTPYDTTPWEDASRGDSPDAWKGFRPHLEVNLHNLVHRWVGGTMGDMTSPNDPVFWLHHSNCDRLWTLWQALHPTELPYLPQSGAASGHNLNDIMIFRAPDSIAPWEGSYRPADVLDNRALGIGYDTDPPGAPKFEMSAWKERLGSMQIPTIEDMLPKRSLPMFALAPELPALAGGTVKGRALDIVGFSRIPTTSRFKFSIADEAAFRERIRTKNAPSGPPPTYTCPYGDDVTAQVYANCARAGGHTAGCSGNVNLECPKKHWAVYLCPK
jgi:tyrosinase